MGVETPMPPIAMNAPRPEGRPAAGIITVEKAITGFHASGVSARSCAFLLCEKRKTCFKKSCCMAFQPVLRILPSVVIVTGCGSEAVYATRVSTSRGPFVIFVPSLKVVYPSPPPARKSTMDTV